MVMSRVMSSLRRYWLTAVVVAVLVAIAGTFLVRLSQPDGDRSTSMTQVGVTGPFRERERYAVDLDEVAQSVSEVAAVYLESDVVLSKVVAELPVGTSLGQLKGMVTVDLVPRSSILEIKATSADAELADLVIVTMQREAIALIGQLSEKRFEGETPLAVTVLVDSSRVQAAPASPLIANAVVLILGLVAGVAAAVLRGTFETRLRHRDDVIEIEPRLPVIDGPWDESARLVRAEIDVAGAKVVLVVPAGRGDATAALTCLANQFDQTGQACRAVRIGGRPADGFADVSADSVAAVAERGSDSSRLTVAAGADSSTLTRARLTETLDALRADDSVVLVLTERPEESVAFTLLRRTADMVVVVASRGVDRKRELRTTLANVTDVRADSSADLVWSGA